MEPRVQGVRRAQTVYNGFIRRSRLDVFSKIFGGGASPI
jgi:hypothetical protein